MTAKTDSAAERLKRRAGEYIEAVNKMVSSWPEFLDVDATFKSGDGEEEFFWLGTLRKAEGGIDFTQGASARVSIAQLAECVLDQHQASVERMIGAAYADACTLLGLADLRGQFPTLCPAR